MGVLVDDTRVSKYVRDLIDWARKTPAISLQHLFIHHVDRPEPSRWARLLRRKGRAELAFGVLSRLESLTALRNTEHFDHFKLFDVRGLVTHAVPLSPEVSPGRQILRFPDADLDRIRASNLDVLVRYGSGILKGDILNVAPLGIVSLHHGDNRINRGGPAGFWEVYSGSPRSGYIVQRLTEELDGGQVLWRGDVATQRSFARNQAELYSRANEALKAVLSSLAAGSPVSPEESAPYSSRLYRLPTLPQVAAYTLRLGRRARAGGWLPRIARHSILYGIRDNWKTAAFWRSRPFAAPHGERWSDPSLVQSDSRLFCFCTEQTSTGERAVAAIDVGANPVRVGIAVPGDLAAPFVFRESDGAWLAAQSGSDVEVFRCVEMPLHWQLEAVVLKGRSHARPMLFKDRDRWWLLVNTELSRNGDAELHAFWAPAPSGPWQPHRGNPIKRGRDGVLNAGLLDHNGSTYRAALVFGRQRLPAAIALHRIQALEEDTYRETETDRILSDFDDHAVAPTRVASAGGFTVLACLARRDTTLRGAYP